MTNWRLSDNRVYRNGIAVRPIDLVKEVKSLEVIAERQDKEINRLLDMLENLMENDHQVIVELREKIKGHHDS